MNARVNLSLRQLAATLGGEVSGSQVLAPGPGHSPSDRSMSVKLDAEKGYVANSFAGNTWQECREYIDAKIGAPKWEPGQSESADDIVARMKAKAGKSDAPKGRIVATYDYTDADGTLLYQIVRFDPKDFRQRQPNGKGGWIWKSHSRQVLYHWPDLIKYPDATVFVCEGEKDADRLASLGHCAVSVDGRGKWSGECVEALRGRDIFVLEDNDEKGQKRGSNAALALKGAAKSLRVVRLPGLGDGGDVSDWLDADGARADELVGKCLRSPKYEDAAEQVAPPKLIVSSGEFVRGYVPPEYLIDGIFQRRFIYSLTAATGTGKTAVALLIAALVALGRALCGCEIDQGAVLYLAGENPDDVRSRWIAMAERMGFGSETIPVHFLAGVFKISEIKQRIRDHLKEIGPVALVIVDTSTAYFPGDDDNNNVQMGAHARCMRELTELPGGPTVLALCHPVKNPDPDNIVPKGGGNFLNEVDGNAVLIKDDRTVTMTTHGKFRGADFEPPVFELLTVTSDKLVNSKGKKMPTVIAKPMNEQDQKRAETQTRGDEDVVLIAVLDHPGASLAGIADALRWQTRKGAPDKSRVQRRVTALKKGKYLTADRKGHLELTEKGKKEAQEAKTDAALAGSTYS